jgi:hypothetical protein
MRSIDASRMSDRVHEMANVYNLKVPREGSPAGSAKSGRGRKRSNRAGSEDEDACPVFPQNKNKQAPADHSKSSLMMDSMEMPSQDPIVFDSNKLFTQSRGIVEEPETTTANATHTMDKFFSQASGTPRMPVAPQDEMEPKQPGSAGNDMPSMPDRGGRTGKKKKGKKQWDKPGGDKDIVKVNRLFKEDALV